MIDFNFENHNVLKSGSILLSEPFSNDEHFARSMVLICSKNDDGCFGFVLNKYIKNKPNELIKDLPPVNSKISIGGPVDISNLFYVHSFGKEIPESIHIESGLYVGGDLNMIKRKLIEQPNQTNEIRFFVGYSGWNPGQLEEEIKNKFWIVINNIKKEEILNTNTNNLWSKNMEKLGGKFQIMSKFPQNPSDN